MNFTETAAPLLDPAGCHLWIPTHNESLSWEKWFRFYVNPGFLKTAAGRASFLFGMASLKRELDNHNWCKHICSLDVRRVLNEEDLTTVQLAITLYLYHRRDVLPNLGYLARCLMARRAIERALKHQGIMHRDVDVIPLIGAAVWQTHDEDEWK